MAHLLSSMLELCIIVPVLMEKNLRQARQRKGWGLAVGHNGHPGALATLVGTHRAIGPALLYEPCLCLFLGVEFLDRIHEGDALAVALSRP